MREDYSSFLKGEKDVLEKEISKVIGEACEFIKILATPTVRADKKVIPPDVFKDDVREDNRQAIGCLHELTIIVTSCLDVNASDDAQKQAQCVLDHILSTGLIKTRPTYYRFDWEKELYERLVK